jgi:hypothetical protein
MHSLAANRGQPSLGATRPSTSIRSAASRLHSSLGNRELTRVIQQSEGSKNGPILQRRPDEGDKASEAAKAEPRVGKIMRVNAPDDPGWVEIKPIYLFISLGEPVRLPHFLKVKVVALLWWPRSMCRITIQEGRYEGHDVVIHRDHLQDDPGSPGYADTRLDVPSGEFYYGGVGPLEAATAPPDKEPDSGEYKLIVPDFPHDKGEPYGPYATTWFLLDGTGDKYLHPGFVSLGCTTVRIKASDTTTWPRVWRYLIDARQADGVVGKITINNPHPIGDDWVKPPDAKAAPDPNPLGGNITGPQGQEVWHPPGTAQGGVPVD